MGYSLVVNFSLLESKDALLNDVAIYEELTAHKFTSNQNSDFSQRWGDYPLESTSPQQHFI